MTKIYALIICMVFFCTTVLAQIPPQSFKYQIVLKNNGGEPLVKKEAEIRLSILKDASDGTVIYCENHTVQTNRLGMANLVIGKGQSSDDFSQIKWESGDYFLKVEMAIRPKMDFIEIGNSQFLSVPYALHSKSAELITSDPVIVNNLIVRHNAEVGDSMKINILKVEGNFESKNLTIKSNLSGDDESFNSYPLKIEGADQGIAIEVSDWSQDHNYISFWTDNEMRGRIEAQNIDDLEDDWSYKWTTAMSAVDGALIVAEGIACGAQLDLAEAVVMAVEGVVVIAKWLEWEINIKENIGVSYASGSGDYAEWLKKRNSSEKFTFGDIVGVKGGYISKTTDDADHLMVVSLSPIVLGKMPKKTDEALYEKVAFMGQVLVKVKGEVQIGDYIIPSGSNDGVGIAINPEKMMLSDYKKIVGVAWSVSAKSSWINMVNVAVGINSNDLVAKLEKQEQELNKMKTTMNNIIAYLKAKDPSFDESLFTIDNQDVNSNGDTNDTNESNDHVTLNSNKLDYTEIERLIRTKPQLYKKALDIVKEAYEKKGIKINEIPKLKKIFEDPEYTLVFLKDLGK